MREREDDCEFVLSAVFLCAVYVLALAVVLFDLFVWRP
jgi:hypothetical protein